MKTLLLATMLLTSTSLYASDCQVANMILAPSVKTAEDCSTLRTWGPATLSTCASTQQAELTIAAGGVYDLKATEAGFVSKTSFQDEDRSSLTTILTLNTATKTYDVQEVQTDSRGHVTSHLSCSGKVQLN